MSIAITGFLASMRQPALIFLLALLISPAAWPATNYTAASAVLSNGAEIQDCPSCPDGKRIGRIGGDDNGTVTFPNVVVPTGGLYPMTVYFMTPNDSAFDIAVNHEAIPRAVIFRRNNRQDEHSSQTIQIGRAHV